MRSGCFNPQPLRRGAEALGEAGCDLIDGVSIRSPSEEGLKLRALMGDDGDLVVSIRSPSEEGLKQVLDEKAELMREFQSAAPPKRG